MGAQTVSENNFDSIRRDTDINVYCYKYDNEYQSYGLSFYLRLLHVIKLWSSALKTT